MRDMGIMRPGWQRFITTSGMIAVINSVLAGVFAGLLARWLIGLAPLACVGIGVAGFLLSVVTHQRYQARQWAELERNLTVLFPSK